MAEPVCEELRIEPVGAALGAVVTGVDLCRHMPDEHFETIRDAFAKYGVLFFLSLIHI